MKKVINEEKKGIELYFDSKPGQMIIDILKGTGFRWHNAKKCWYVKTNDEIIKVVELIESGKYDLGKSIEKQTKDGIKIGDIFVNSWGWEQTNVDCYQVVDIVGTSTVKLKEISHEMVRANSSMSADVIPLKDSFASDDITTKRTKNRRVNFEHGVCDLWDGKRSYYCSWYA